MAYNKWMISVCILGLALWAAYRYQDVPLDLNFTTTRGEKIALNQWRGSPVLLTFWASDCPSCLAEMQVLSELYRQYQPKGLKMMGVAMAYDMPSRVLSLANALAYPNAFDLQAGLAKALKVELIPDTFLLDAQGKIVWRHMGLLDASVLRLEIEKILAEI